MTIILHWGIIISICCFGLSTFANVFFPMVVWADIASFFGLMAFILFLFYLPLRKIVLPLFIFLLSLFINLTMINEPLVQVIWTGLRQMDALISLLIIVPIVGWTLAEEPYIEEIVAFFSGALNSSKRFYTWIMAITQVIAYFLLFGCVPMVYQFVQKILGHREGEAWDYFKSSAISRSFALSACWVISIPSFAVAVNSMGASLGTAILQGFFLSALAIGISVLFFHFHERKSSVDLSQGIKEEIERVQPSPAESKHSKLVVLEFMGLFLSLFGIILLLNYLLTWDLLIIIPTVILFWTFLYYVVKRKLNVFWEKGKLYIAKGLITRSQEMSLLFAAGMLIYSLNISGLGYQLVDGLFALTSKVSLLNPLMILPFILIILGFLGLGPLTVMVLVGGILQSFQFPYPPELMLAALTLGSAISLMISPLVIPIIVLSGANKLSVFTNSLKYNLGYAVVLYIVFQIYIQGMAWILGY